LVTQEQNEPSFIKELRRKARVADTEIPRLQRDIALLRAGVDETAPVYEMWRNDYQQRVNSGQAVWDADAVYQDAKKYGLLESVEAAQ
jgi:hypothetical protein